MFTRGGFRRTGHCQTFQPIVSVAVLEGRHVLMVRQGLGNDHGRWNLPGGKVDLGESLLHAATREMREETGYRVEITGLGGLYTYVNPRSKKHSLRLLFFAKVVSGKPRADGREILDVRWFHLDQVLAMESRELCKPRILRKIVADLRRRGPRSLELLHEFGVPLSAAS